MAAQMKREGMFSVNICEQAICEEREQELDNVEKVNGNQMQRVYEGANIQDPKKEMTGLSQLYILMSTRIKAKM